MTDTKAMQWYQAELRANTPTTLCPEELQDRPPTWFELTERRREDIRKRVELVLTGEVRRSEMGPGDLSIYFGRYRMLETSPPVEFVKRYQRRDLQRMVWWDCLEFIDSGRWDGFPRKSTYARLFDNANVGRLDLTNLQVAGQMAGDQATYFGGWHVTINDQMTPLIEEVFSVATVTLCVGDRPQAQRKLIQLVNEPWPIEVYIPTRQCFGANVEFTGKVFTEFCDMLQTQQRDPERDPFRVWVNLEGWLMRDVY